MLAFFLSDNFSAIATFLSLLGDVAILILTIYTFHLTTVSRKLELTSPSFSSSTFYGEIIGLNIMNKSLHSIPIQNVFIMKQLGKNDFGYITVASFDDPLTIESWTIKKIESEPFTSILGYEGSMADLIKDSIIGVTYAHKTLWLKPYTKVPLWAARRAYRKRNYQIMTVTRNNIAGRILSERVDCVIRLRMKDINGQIVLRTIFGITHFDNGKSVLLSEDVNGYTALGVPGENKKEIIDALVQMGFEKNDVDVQIIERNPIG